MKKEAGNGFFFVLHWTQSVAEAGQGNPESNGHKAASSERGPSYAAGLWTQDQLRAVCDSEIDNPIFWIDLPGACCPTEGIVTCPLCIECREEGTGCVGTGNTNRGGGRSPASGGGCCQGF